MKELKTLIDVEELLPPLSEEEYEGLKADILQNGCRDPIVIWNDTILDGHHRYKICSENNIEFRTVERTFGSITEAKMWILKNQSSRRNLTPYARVQIALQLKPLMEELAKQRQSMAGGDRKTDEGKERKSLPANSPEAFGDSRDQIAQIAGVGSNTVARVEYIEEHADEATKEKLRRGDKDVSVNKVYTELREKENAPIKLSSEIEPIELDDPEENDFDPRLIRANPNALYEPCITLKDISSVHAGPLISALFDIFTEEFRAEFTKMFVDAYVRNYGREKAEELLNILTQRITSDQE